MSRNESIDVIKGILVIFVIIGHILLGSLDDNGLRYFIYSFHMPAFFFISGYLLNLEKISTSPPTTLFASYWKRMLFQWGIALIVYALLISYSELSLRVFLSKILYPYYHLWYVPTFFVFIIIIKLFRYIKEDSVFFLFLVVIGLVFNSLTVTIKTGEIRLYFFIFFLLGIFVKRLKITIDNLLLGGVIFAGFIVLIIALFLSDINYEFYSINLRLPCLLLICSASILAFISCDRIHSRLFGFLGKHSLEVYLWHVVPIILFKKVFPENHSFEYYMTSFSVLTIFIVTCWIFTKNKIFLK